jgi:hypothetical protein
MMPIELVTLAEARREAFETEIRLQRQLSLLPQQPARWRQWTSGSLMWAGSTLVQWGEGMLAKNCSQEIKVIG